MKDRSALFLTGFRPYAWLLLLCAALYLPGLAAMPVTDRDEARFTQASRQMMETGDLVRIRFQTQARNKKPAGIYWLQALSVSAVSDPATRARWPYRLPSVLGATLSVLWLFALGALLFDRRTGFLAAGGLAASLLLVVEAHIAKTDAFLLATIMASMYGLARAYLDVRLNRLVRWPTFLLFWGGLGVGLLIKGPITPLIAGLTLIGVSFANRPLPLWRALRPLWGVPLMLAIAAPWFVAIILADADFVRESAGKDFLAKIASGQEAHGFPPGFYLFLLTAVFAPMSLFVWTALVWVWRRRRDPDLCFALCWLVPFWLLLELVPTKLPHYILPLLPALALIVARAVRAVEQGDVRLLRHWLTRGYYVLWGALVIGFPIAVFALGPAVGHLPAWGMVIAIVAALIAVPLAVRAAWRTELRRALWTAILAAPFVMGPVFAVGLPSIDTIWVSRAADRLIRQDYPDRADQPPVFATGFREPSLVFRLGTDLVFAEPAQLVGHLAGKKRWLALVEKGKLAAFQAALKKYGVAAVKKGAIEGINYSRGRPVRLILFSGTAKPVARPPRNNRN